MESPKTQQSEADIFGNLAKSLAHNERKFRDRAVKKVSQWMVQSNKFSTMDASKLCRGLFYCLWFSDKPLVQLEVAESIARLVHTFKNSGLDHQEAIERTITFMKAFMQEFEVEWIKIDKLRLDKFYSLLRKFLYHCFMLVSEWNFDPTFCGLFFNFVRDEVLFPNLNKPAGIRYHMTDIYLDELIRCLRSLFPQIEELQESPDADISIVIPSQAVASFLNPYYELLASIHDKIMIKHIVENVFENILEVDIVSLLDLKDIGDRLFAVAADSKTSGQARKLLYKLYQTYRKKHQELHPDEEWLLPGTKSKAAAKRKRSKTESTAEAPNQPENTPTETASEQLQEPIVTETAIVEDVSVSEGKKKKKKKARKEDVVQEVIEEQTPEIVAPQEVTPPVVEAPPQPTNALPPKSKKSKKAKKAQEDADASQVQETTTITNEAPKALSAIDSTPSKKKGVVFGLDKNTVKEYIKNEMMSGPITPVRLTQPKFGVLKTPSPMLPRRQLSMTTE